ncbi:MAG TPA: 1,4-alpha-glucan branching protein domain-containing protein [Acidobacteriota bacterium]|jgi:1,4-alpha-glucan branching enzyme
MPIGYLALVLHAHLPFVRHPEYEYFLEEDWLYEAITETYLPLIEIFDKLVYDQVPFQLTMTVSPPLASMLEDSLLQERYRHHLDKLLELSKREIVRTKQDPHFRYLADFYRQRFESARDIYLNRYGGNLMNAFRNYQRLGCLEIITCGATHAFLPNYVVQPQVIRAQIQIAADHYRKVFGCSPKGIWLPECGYFPGVDEFLAEEDIHFFFTDAHGILHAQPRPLYGTYAPVFSPDSGVAAFGRDLESSRQVWSSKEGYPGDPEYREFYRDIGYDLDQDYIAPYVQPDGKRKHTGIKYYRITGDVGLGEKAPYDPYRALHKADLHAGNFMFNRERQIEHLFSAMGKPPIVVAPYDAELFGHWWYEGPIWLEYLIRKTAYDQDVFQLITPANFLRKFDTHQACTPSFSSWGDQGYASYWLNETNDWIYRHLHEMGFRMIEAADGHTNPTMVQRRLLNQAARELLLAESSDWAFIMKAGTMVEYAINRTRRHGARFYRLLDDLRHDRADEEWLKKVEYLDNIFPDIDYRKYCSAPQFSNAEC